MPLNTHLPTEISSKSSKLEQLVPQDFKIPSKEEWGVTISNKMAANNSGKAQLKKITVVTLEIKKQCPTMLLDVTSVSSWQHYWDRRMKLKGDICGGK